jgi:hypothetical protein
MKKLSPYFYRNTDFFFPLCIRVGVSQASYQKKYIDIDIYFLFWGVGISYYDGDYELPLPKGKGFPFQ